MIRIILIAFLALSGCLRIGGAAPEPRQRAEDLETFATQVQEDLESHSWQNILTSADPEHYRIQVVEMGMDEPQYVAEIFGLHRVDNNIQEGDTLDWQDLERIESVRLEPAQTETEPFTLTGSAALADGTTLQLEARVARVRTRYVLTGGVG